MESFLRFDSSSTALSMNDFMRENNDLFVSSNYDIQGLGGHVAVAQRHGDAHLKAEAKDRV